MPAYGFLSTLETPQHGYFGGYLVVSAMGRPLEFHCTAPVRPSRAQEILYGTTLHSYLLGDQIGSALLREAQISPSIVLTDCVAAMCLRATLDVPLVLVGERIVNCIASAASGTQRSLFEHRSAVGLAENLAGSDPTPNGFIAGGYELRFAFGFELDRATAIEHFTALAKYVDLAEPFGRIHEAIREAQRLGERGQEFHGRSAA